jgi:hypothetical protein
MTATFSAGMINGTNDFIVISWTGLANGESGSAYAIPTFADKTLQIGGTLGVGGTVLLEGSNDGTNFVAMHDTQGNNLSFTSAQMQLIVENPRYIRPRVTAGDGSTSITVTIACRSR